MVLFHSILQDDSDTPNYHVKATTSIQVHPRGEQATWRSKLINRFKNSRKGSKRKLPNDSNNDSVDEPPNKVAKGSTPSRFYIHPNGESLPEADG